MKKMLNYKIIPTNNKLGGYNMKKEYKKPFILISEIESASNIALISNVQAVETPWEDSEDVWAEFY